MKHEQKREGNFVYLPGDISAWKPKGTGENIVRYPYGTEKDIKLPFKITDLDPIFTSSDDKSKLVSLGTGIVITARMVGDDSVITFSVDN